MIGIVSLIRNAAPSYTPRMSSIPMLGLGSMNAEAQMNTVRTSGMVFAIIDALGDAAATATWRLMPIGSDDEKDAIVNHPAAQLWAKPNSFYDQGDFVKTILQHYNLVGESEWYISRNQMSPIPLELWPVRPDRVAPVPSATQFLDGWVYMGPDGAKIPWRRDEVVQMKMPNPFDPYRGLGPLAAAMVDVYGERAAAEYNATFFRNSAEPGGVIEFEERLPDEEYDEFVKRWREQHQGVDNAHRVAILERAKWVERRYTLREMQFSESRKLNRDFIRQAFRFPKSVLGDADDVNKATALAGIVMFNEFQVKPLLNDIKSALNGKLLPLFGTSTSGMEFCYTLPVPADKELEISDRDSKATAAKTLVEAGFDPDAVLKYVGLPPMKHTNPAPEPVSAPDPAPQEPNDAPKARARTENDPIAKGIYERGEALRREYPGITIEQVSLRLGVSDRTYRRYRAAFE